MIVIGGGVNGLWAAYLAKQRGLNVTIIDPYLAERSSEKGSRHINVWYAKPKAEVQQRGVSYWDRLCDQLDLSVVRTDCLQFVGAEERQAIIDANKANGQPAEILSPEVIQKRFGVTHEKEGVFLPNLSRMMDMAPTLRTFREYLESTGVKFVTSESVTGLSQNGSRCKVVLSNGKSIDTDYVAVCAGPWMRNLLAPLGIELDLKVTQQQYCLFELAERDLSAEGRWPLVEDDLAFDGGEYYTKPAVGNLPMKVALDNEGPEVTPDAPALPLNDEETERVIQYARKRYGSSLKYLGTETCRYTLTPDWGIVADFVPSMDRVVFAHNCGGGGCKSAPALAEIMLNYLTGEKQQLDVSHFTLRYHTTRT